MLPWSSCRTMLLLSSTVATDIRRNICRNNSCTDRPMARSSTTCDCNQSTDKTYCNTMYVQTPPEWHAWCRYKCYQTINNNSTMSRQYHTKLYHQQWSPGQGLDPVLPAHPVLSWGAASSSALNKSVNSRGYTLEMWHFKCHTLCCAAYRIIAVHFVHVKCAWVQHG